MNYFVLVGSPEGLLFVTEINPKTGLISFEKYDRPISFVSRDLALNVVNRLRGNGLTSFLLESDIPIPSQFTPIFSKSF